MCVGQSGGEIAFHVMSGTLTGVFEQGDMDSSPFGTVVLGTHMRQERATRSVDDHGCDTMVASAFHSD